MQWTVPIDQECGPSDQVVEDETDGRVVGRPLDHSFQDFIKDAQRADLVIDYLKKHGLFPKSPGGFPILKPRSPEHKAPESP